MRTLPTPPTSAAAEAEYARATFRTLAVLADPSATPMDRYHAAEAEEAACAAAGAEIEAGTSSSRQYLDMLEAEVAELRRGAAMREALVDAVEARAYTRGRESVLGGGAGQSARTPQAGRWLHAVADAEAEPELEAGA